MSRNAERKFWRCVGLLALFIMCVFGLSVLAGPEAAIPEWVFSGGCFLAVIAGLVFG